MFGDEKCGKWLTSIFTSILTSVLLTQPLQVALITTFFVLLFRKSNDDQDNLEYDRVDDEKPINKLKLPQWKHDQLNKNKSIEDDFMNNKTKLDEKTIEDYKKKKEREKKAKNKILLNK